jgi:hypothetical protein
MYRDDDVARGERAHALISEIADLERQKVARAELDQRLETARVELAALQVTPSTAPPEPRLPGVLVHLLVFGVAASATFAGYTLLV